MANGGLLVVLEGPEGAGKTTQLRRLSEWLGASGRPVGSRNTSLKVNGVVQRLSVFVLMMVISTVLSVSPMSK